MPHLCQPSPPPKASKLKGIARKAMMAAATVVLGLGYSQVAQSDSNSKPARLELASAFHPADPMFGRQLTELVALIKTRRDGSLKLRRSRKAQGASVRQMIDLIGIQSIDAALVDPITLGYRPAIAQLFGGIPFGPGAAEILDWSRSSQGAGQIDQSFSALGLQALICGHRESLSGVFARHRFVWPAPARPLVIHSRGLADPVYQGMNITPRPLHGADQYMGYATGVVDLMVSLNPAMDARSGYGQVSRYFYYPSWERRSAFAFLLINRDRWESLSTSNRDAITTSCQTLNKQPLNVDITAAIGKISRQGSGDTLVEPWPTAFLSAARAIWVKAAAKTLERHPSLAPAFRALNIPSNTQEPR